MVAGALRDVGAGAQVVGGGDPADDEGVALLGRGQPAASGLGGRHRARQACGRGLAPVAGSLQLGPPDRRGVEIGGEALGAAVELDHSLLECGGGRGKQVGLGLVLGQAAQAPDLIAVAARQGLKRSGCGQRQTEDRSSVRAGGRQRLRQLHAGSCRDRPCLFQLDLQPGDLGNQGEQRSDDTGGLDSGRRGHLRGRGLGQLRQAGLQRRPPGVGLGDNGCALHRGRRRIVAAGGEAFSRHRRVARGSGVVEQGGDPLRGVRGFDLSGDVQPRRLDDAGEHLRDALVDVVQRASALLSARDKPPLHVGETAGVEQALQQLATLLCVGAEELGELSLRQQHHLAELREAEPEQVSDELPGLVQPRGQRGPSVWCALLEVHLGRLGRDAGPAELGSVPLRRPSDAQTPAAQRHLEHHLRSDPLVGVVAAHRPTGVAGARHMSVEREADGVEDARLACAGRAGEQEQTGRGERVEVDALGGCERPERGDLEAMKAHQRLDSASRTPSKPATSRAASAGSAGPRTCADEVGRHLDVGAAPDPGGVGRRPFGGTVGRERENQDVREPLPQPLHRLARAHRIGQGDLQEVVDEARPARPGEEVVEPAGDAGQRPVHRRRHRLDGQRRARPVAQLDDQQLLGLVLLGERERQGRPAVADPVGEPLRAVEVPERGVVDAVEDRPRHGRDAADGDVALALARLGPGDERMGQHDRAGVGTVGEVSPHPSHHRVEDRCVAALVAAELDAHGIGLEVGHGVDGHRPGRVVEQDRPMGLRHVGAQVDAGEVDQPGPEAEASGGVVVAADEHDSGARGGQPAERVVEDGDRIDRGQRPVVDVAGDDHHVDALGPHRLDQEVDELPLGRQQVLPVEGPPEVPVGGVQQPHSPTVGGGSDTPRHPRRRVGCRH